MNETDKKFLQDCCRNFSRKITELFQTVYLRLVSNKGQVCDLILWYVKGTGPNFNQMYYATTG